MPRIAGAVPRMLGRFSILQLRFPEPAMVEFAKYADDLSRDRNPYHHHQDMKFALAYKMNQSLDTVLRGSEVSTQERDDARYLLQTMERMRDGLEEPAVLIINGFPVDSKESLLSTPSDPTGYDPDKKEDRGKEGFVTECAMLAFNTAIHQDVVTNPNVQGGLFTHHLSPRKGMSGVASNAGAGFFPVHIEGTHLPTEEMVDGLTLTALKNSRSPTIYVPIMMIEQKLREELGERFDMLLEPRFKFVAGVAYNTNSDSGVIEPMIYTDDKGNIVRWRMNANLDKVSPADPKDKEAGEVIVKVAEVLESLKQEVVLQYGDFLRINNATGAAHSRAPIHPQDSNPNDPTNNRHLLRQQTMRSDPEIQSQDPKSDGISVQSAEWISIDQPTQSK